MEILQLLRKQDKEIYKCSKNSNESAAQILFFGTMGNLKEKSFYLSDIIGNKHLSGLRKGNKILTTTKESGLRIVKQFIF